MTYVFELIRLLDKISIYHSNISYTDYTMEREINTAGKVIKLKRENTSICIMLSFLGITVFIDGDEVIRWGGVTNMVMLKHKTPELKGNTKYIGFLCGMIYRKLY